MLLHYNKGLVRQFVWRCKHLGTEVAFGELALAGDEALLKAAIKWDPNKGTRFTTYAFQRVNRSEFYTLNHLPQLCKHFVCFGCDCDVCVLIMTSVSPTFGSLFCLSSCVLHMLAVLQSPSVSCKQLYASCDNTALSVSLLCIHAFVQPVSALVSVSC